MTGHVTVTFKGGVAEPFVCILPEKEVMKFLKAPGGIGEPLKSFVVRKMLAAGISEEHARQALGPSAEWSIGVIPDVPDLVDKSAALVTPVGDVRPKRRVAKCRSTLTLASRVLPATMREEALDEWMDHIETAAAEGLPVFRRAASIILRSLPIMVLRGHVPARVRRGGS